MSTQTLDMRGETQLVSLDERAGTDISKARGFDEVMQLAGFDFDTERVPVHTPEGKEVPGHFIIRRGDTQQPFAVMRKRYTPIPMDEMFRPFHDVVTKNGATYESAGLINGGRKAWITALLPDNFKVGNNPNDKFTKRIAALASNDGSSRNAYFSLAHRICCNNQIRTILSSATASDYSMSHTKNWKYKLMDAEIAFMMAVSALEEFEHDAETLSTLPMTSDQCRTFAAELFPDPVRNLKPSEIIGKSEKEVKFLQDLLNKKDTSSKLTNRREAIVDLFTSGVGNRGVTRLDAMNAMTEFFNHHNNFKKLEKEGTRAAERRLASNLFGGANDIAMRRGKTVLLNTKEFKKTKPAVLTAN
jgi:phage/plasmid-like protein (TIGR03299 family)